MSKSTKKSENEIIVFAIKRSGNFAKWTRTPERDAIYVF